MARLFLVRGITAWAADCELDMAIHAVCTRERELSELHPEPTWITLNVHTFEETSGNAWYDSGGKLRTSDEPRLEKCPSAAIEWDGECWVRAYLQWSQLPDPELPPPLMTKQARWEVVQERAALMHAFEDAYPVGTLVYRLAQGRGLRRITSKPRVRHGRIVVGVEGVDDPGLSCPEVWVAELLPAARVGPSKRGV